MNKNQIEVSAISYLELVITKCKLLQPYINYNDKTPVWDGEIQLYNNKKHTTDYVRRIPVQVKGRTHNKQYNINAPTIKHPLKKIELENFMEDNGIIYFIVVIRGNEHKIFYKRLLPQDIFPILRELGEQQTKKLEFSQFPNTEKDIMSIIDFFIRGRNGKQILPFNKFGETGKIQFVFWEPIKVDDRRELVQAINSENTYAFNIDNNDIKIPLEKVNFNMSIITSLPEQNGVKIDVEDNGEKIIYYIGSNPNNEERSIIVYNENDNTIDGNFKIQGTIENQIKDIKFWLLPENLEFVDKDKLIELQNKLSLLLELKTALDYCQVSTDINLSKLTDKEWGELYYLKDLINNEHTGIKDTTKPFTITEFTFMNSNVLLYKKYFNDNKYKWVNFFTEPISCGFGFGYNKEDIIGKISIFLRCDKHFFKKFANTDYNRILTELKKSDIHPDLIGHFLTTQCSMISAYDEDNTNLEVLDTAYKFGEWIEANTEIDKNSLLLNQLQIKKRKSELDFGDSKLLYSILKNENDSIKFGAYTLLEDYENAKDSFNKIPIEEQNELKNLPIYVLYSKLIENNAVTGGVNV